MRLSMSFGSRITMTDRYISTESIGIVQRNCYKKGALCTLEAMNCVILTAMKNIYLQFRLHFLLLYIHRAMTKKQ